MITTYDQQNIFLIISALLIANSTARNAEVRVDEIYAAAANKALSLALRTLPALLTAATLASKFGSFSLLLLRVLCILITSSECARRSSGVMLESPIKSSIPMRVSDEMTLFVISS